MTKIIGLTGGIGSGKTTISKWFEAENIPVYIADNEAKKMMLLQNTIDKIVVIFGKEILQNGTINTKELSKIVFNNPEKLKQLNQIIHPLVKNHFDNWVDLHSKYPFIIKEVAILFESGSYKYCDKIITVVTNLSTRISRVMQRDNCTEQEVLDRIKNQWTDEQRIEKSDFIIENNTSQIAKEQFLAVLKKLNYLY